MQTKTIYACTHIEKTVANDSYEHGCDTHSRCIISEETNIEATTLPELIEKIASHYCLNLDNLWIPQDENNGQVARFGFNRLENDDGEDPTKQETNQWKKGKKILYLADYDFQVEKRTVSPIPLEEFKTNNINFHE